MLSNKPVTLTCPRCKARVTKSIGWMKAHREFPCPSSCGAVYKTSHFAREIRKVESALDKLRQTIRRFGK